MLKVGFPHLSLLFLAIAGQLAFAQENAPRLPRLPEPDSGHCLLERLREVTQVDENRPIKINSFYTSSTNNGDLKILWDRRLNATVNATNLDRTNITKESLVTDRLEVNGKRYFIVDIGDHVLQADQPIIDSTVKKLQSGIPTRNVEIIASGARKKIYSFIWDAKTRISEKVYEIYREKKGFLSDRDFGKLRGFDMTTVDADIFVLVEDTGKELRNLTGKDIADQAVMTLRVARLSGYHPERPTWLNSNPYQQGLPHHARSKTPGHQGFVDSRELTLKFAAGRKTAELTRFAKFRDSVPDALRNALEFRAFSVATDPASPIDLFIASMDEGVRNRLGKWNFSEWRPMDSGQALEKEYLMFQETNGSAYRNAVHHFDLGRSPALSPALSGGSEKDRRAEPAK